MEHNINCSRCTKGDAFKLCLTEKFCLLEHFSGKHLLNKKSEFNSKCTHENKLLVKSAKKLSKRHGTQSSIIKNITLL